MLNANMRQRLSGIARSLFVAVLMFATLFPFYWTLLISLKNQSDAFQVPPDLIFMPTLENYEELFVTGSFGRYFFNSFVVCVLSIILALLVGIPSAYIFARCEFRFKKAFFYVLLITRMSPGAVFVIPYFIAYKELGFALLLTRQKVQTAPIGVLNFIVFEKMNWGVIAAGAIVIALPVIFFGIAIRKYYVKGLTQGGLAGD